MAIHYYVVLTKAAPGRAEDFHAWYDAQHLPDCARVPGVKSAKRFKLMYEVGPSKDGSQVQEAPYDSLALYELDTDDPLAVARELSVRAGSEAMPLTDALDRWGSVKYVAVPAAEV